MEVLDVSHLSVASSLSCATSAGGVMDSKSTWWLCCHPCQAGATWSPLATSAYQENIWVYLLTSLFEALNVTWNRTYGYYRRGFVRRRKQQEREQWRISWLLSTNQLTCGAATNLFLYEVLIEKFAGAHIGTIRAFLGLVPQMPSLDLSPVSTLFTLSYRIFSEWADLHERS